MADFGVRDLLVAAVVALLLVGPYRLQHSGPWIAVRRRGEVVPGAEADGGGTEVAASGGGPG